MKFQRLSEHGVPEGNLDLPGVKQTLKGRSSIDGGTMYDYSTIVTPD